MSLEDALKENTQVVRAFTEALVKVSDIIIASANGKGGVKIPHAETGDDSDDTDHEVKQPAKKPAPKKEAAKTAAPEKKSGPFVRSDTAKTAEKTNAGPTGKLNYETDVRPVTFKFAAEVGRPALNEIFDQFGIKTATELQPDQYQAYLDALKEAENNSVA